jgi:hypothetical protein
MTDTATEPSPAAATDTWNLQLENLKSRYKHVRGPVLVALNILLHDENIEIADAKAQAQMHGVRITAASIQAARTLLSKMDAPPSVIAGANHTPTPARPVRRPRPADKATDAESLIRGLVVKLQDQGNAEADGLREAMRKAIAMLQAAIGDR